jgi:hypothetical protein
MGGESKAWIGYNPNSGVILYNYACGKVLGLTDDGTPHYNGKTLYHTGNFNPNDYFPKSGGTITGNSVNPLVVDTNDNSCYIEFNVKKSNKGYVGYDSGVDIFLQNSSGKYINLVGNTLKLNNNETFIHSGNLGSYAPVYNSNGNVLIGTTDDNDSGAKLQVRGGITATHAYFGGKGTGIHIGVTYSGNTNGAYDLIERGASGGALYMQYSHNGGIYMCYGGGNVLIGTTTNNGSKLQVNGNITAEGTIAMAKLASSSDRKLKDNIADVSAEQSMDIIRQLRPTTWDWKKDGKKSYGLIAQEVEPIVPEMVVDMGHLHLEYNQLHAFEIGAIQHLDVKVETQEQKIKRLENRVNELENELRQYRRA